MGDGNYQGTGRSDSNDLMRCVPYKRPSAGTLSQAARRFNGQQRRFRVAVENTIGEIKKWKSVGNGKVLRHLRTLEKEVFNVCARLTARIMRVRDQYQRRQEWIGEKIEGWESRLGVHYYYDEESPESHFHNDKEVNLVYDNIVPGEATTLQGIWEEIWGYTGVKWVRMYVGYWCGFRVQPKYGIGHRGVHRYNRGRGWKCGFQMLKRASRVSIECWLMSWGDLLPKGRAGRDWANPGDRLFSNY